MLDRLLLLRLRVRLRCRPGREVERRADIGPEDVEDVAWEHEPQASAR